MTGTTIRVSVIRRHTLIILLMVQLCVREEPLAGNPLTLIFPILSRYIYTTILLSVRHSVKTHTILYRQVPTRHILYTIISLLISILHISINYTNKTPLSSNILYTVSTTDSVLYSTIVLYYTEHTWFSPAVKLLIRSYTLQ